MTQRRVAELEAELEAAKAAKQRPDAPSMTAMWRGYRGGITEQPEDADTRVPRAVLEHDRRSDDRAAARLHAAPQDRAPARAARADGPGRAADRLGHGASCSRTARCCSQGVNVRMSGQDCSRGTFSHRHAIITDIKTGREHLVLGQLHHDQGLCRIYDSPLSEAGVLGFEFGYSLDYPDALVMWEAQFGDFANGAQVIIDQFIIASEDKWKRLSGIVLLLPHGYEGQGPEHSSARLERYLQSCAEHNIQVAQPTTPAQMFHLLRGQVLRPLRKPLVVMTPKSLLRLPAAASTLDELATASSTACSHDERRRSREGHARAAVHRQDLLRARRGAHAARRPGDRDRADREALSVVAAPGRGCDARQVPAARRAVLGPGRAVQHGRRAVRDAAAASAADRGRAIKLRAASAAPRARARRPARTRRT